MTGGRAVLRINVEVEVGRTSVGGLGRGYGRFEEDTGRGHWNRLAAERSSEVFALSTRKNNGLWLAGMPGSSMKNASPRAGMPYEVSCRLLEWQFHVELTDCIIWKLRGLNVEKERPGHRRSLALSPLSATVRRYGLRNDQYSKV